METPHWTVAAIWCTGRCRPGRGCSKPTRNRNQLHVYKFCIANNSYNSPAKPNQSCTRGPEHFRSAQKKMAKPSSPNRKGVWAWPPSLLVMDQNPGQVDILRLFAAVELQGWQGDVMAGLMHTLTPIHTTVASAGAFSEVSIHIHTLAHNEMDRRGRF